MARPTEKIGKQRFSPTLSQPARDKLLRLSTAGSVSRSEILERLIEAAEDIGNREKESGDNVMAKRKCKGR